MRVGFRQRGVDGIQAFREKWQNLLIQHTGLFCLCLLRVFALSTLLFGVGAAYYATSLSGSNILYAANFSLTMAVYSNLVIQWANTIHLSEDTVAYKRLRQIFLCLNILANVLILVGLLVLFLQPDIPQSLLVAFLLISLFSFVLAVTFFVYGSRIARKLGKGTPLLLHLSCKTIAGRFSFAVVVISLAFLVESILAMLCGLFPETEAYFISYSGMNLMAIISIIFAFWRTVSMLSRQLDDLKEDNIQNNYPLPPVSSSNDIFGVTPGEIMKRTESSEDDLVGSADETEGLPNSSTMVKIDSDHPLS